MNSSFDLFLDRKKIIALGESFNKLSLVPQAIDTYDRIEHRNLGNKILFNFLSPLSLKMFQKQLYGTHDHSQSMDDKNVKDFDIYLYHYLNSLCELASKNPQRAYNYLIWDEYGIKQYENISLIPINPKDLKMDKRFFLKERLISSNARCYVTNEIKFGEINKVCRIRHTSQPIKVIDDNGRILEEKELIDEDFYESLSSYTYGLSSWYNELSVYLDFNWLDPLKGYAYYKSDVIEKIDVNRIEFSAKKTKGENRLGYVSWELVFNGNDELQKIVKQLVNEAVINKTNEELQLQQIEEARKERYRYNKRNRHSRDYYISFNETNHTYTVDGNTLQSVTNIVENCFPKFDAQLHAKTTAAKMGMTEEEVIAMWERKGKESRELGTAMHQKIESYYQGKDSREDDAFRLFKVFADKVKLEPYRTEWAVYDTDYNIAGTIDFVDYQDGKYTIYDWKRSDKIIANGMPVKVSKYQEKGLYPLEHLENCAYYHYALQLSLYKFILEKNYDIKVSDLRLGIFHPSYDKPYVLRMPYLEKEVKTLMELRSEVIL